MKNVCYFDVVPKAKSHMGLVINNNVFRVPRLKEILKVDKVLFGLLIETWTSPHVCSLNR